MFLEWNNYISSLRKDLASVEGLAQLLRDLLADSENFKNQVKGLQAYFPAPRAEPPAGPGRTSKKQVVVDLLRDLDGCAFVGEVAEALGMSRVQAKRYMCKAISQRPKTTPWRAVSADKDWFVLEDWGQAALPTKGNEQDLASMKASEVAGSPGLPAEPPAHPPA